MARLKRSPAGTGGVTDCLRGRQLSDAIQIRRTGLKLAIESSGVT